MHRLQHTALFIAILLAGAVRADARPVVPQSVWEQRFASEEAEYEYKAGAIASGDQSIWLAVGSRPKGELSGPQRLWLWQLDASGKRQREIDLAGISPRPLIDVKDIVIRPNGSLLLVGEAGEGLFVLLGYDAQRGERSLAKDLSRAGQKFFINRFVNLGDDQYVLVGRASASGLALKLNGAGETIWEQVFTNEKVTVLSDGVRMPDGRLMMVGSHLDPAGIINIWVGALSPTGALASSVRFEGRYAAIAAAVDGTYAVVHDARGTAAWDVFARGLTNELRDAWKTQLLSDPNIGYPFRVGQLTGGEVVVVGAKDARLWVARVGAAGKIRWSVSVQDEGAQAENIWNYGLLSAGTAFVVPYSTLVVNDKMEQRQEIRVVKAMASN